MADEKTTFRPIGAITEQAVAVSENPEGGSNAPVRTTTEHGGDMVTLKSLCMNCGEQGKTTLLLTRIPFFRDVILMAFDCDECGLRNSEVQSADVQDMGCRFECKVETTRDMNRQLVKGDKACFTIAELEFEIPAGTQTGVFTTIEGLMERAIDNLGQSQPVRRAINPADADSVEAFIARLTSFREGRAFPFTVILDDPTGNSFLENPVAPRTDPRLKAKHYVRSKQQNEALGLFAGNRGLGAIAEEGESGEGEAAEQSHPVAIGPEAPEEGEDVDASELSGSGAQTVYNNKAVDLEGAARAYAASLATRASGLQSLSQQAAHRHHNAHEGGVDARALSGAEEQYAVEKAAAAAQLAAEVAAHEALKKRLAEERMARTSDMSGNVPGGFRKGGALIRNETDRAALSTRSGPQKDKGGLLSLIFESSASSSAKEVLAFPQPCHCCAAPGEVRMCVTDVPHFKEMILMAFDCEECGWRNVEVKGGGAVPPHGTVTELHYTPGQPWSADDMIRDVIKGDTAAVAVPELELELDAGSLGGLYSTVEGLLNVIKDKLVENDPFGSEGNDGAGGGDSSEPESRKRMREFLSDLEACIAGTRPFTLQLRDPMANSWVYSPYAGSGMDDPRLNHAPYVRSHEEDLDLGLLDMNAPRQEEGEEGEGELATVVKPAV